MKIIENYNTARQNYRKEPIRMSTCISVASKYLAMEHSQELCKLSIRYL